ncbi:PAS domain S-box-containing protein [Stigmatella aurantiaca]|uniref:histidine kinase n=1 Tax=Stigmatella aurantiaca TaxID=41 RepID=A0A1H8BD63_STIAU|nr:GAF domain-containing sensor histidine kinase [Stigmatella aurantiaca]SEM80389.1 PAS domain S-box-containing protein [Stigmatella aurantiaca]
MPQVADFIENNRGLIVQRYLEEARKLEPARGLTPEQVIDTLPEYLGTLAAISRQGHRGDASVTKKRLEETHIGIRLRSGYSQEEATGEYVLVGRLITSLWEHLPPHEQPSHTDKALLAEALQDAMGQVIVTFTGYSMEDRQREKRFLRRLETIASGLFEALETPVFLHERLEALVETVQQALNVEAAALLLLAPDGTRLVPTTYTGRWSGQAYAEPVDDPDSFVSQLSQSDEPLALPDATDPHARVAEGIRRSGLRSLLGLRMWPHGRLLGVLYIGVEETRIFEPQTKRYLETLVEYLSGIIDKALLLQRLRESNERLRASETLYRMAAEAISDVIWDWDLRTNAVSWSPGLQKLFGYGPKQLGETASSWYGNIHPEEREQVLHSIHEVIGGERTHWRGEYRFRHQNGSYIHVIDQGRVERGPDGKGVRMVGAMQDITERKRAGAALQESEDRLRVAAGAAELGTWDLRPVTGVMRMDDRAKRLFGVPPETEMTYERVLARIHPEDRDRIHVAVQRALAGENQGEYRAEYRTVAPGPRGERWIRSAGRAFFEGTRAVRFIGIFQDISERKRQEALARMQTEFEEQLIGIVSHDLRNPLNAITLSVAALMRNDDLNERQAKGVSRIQASAERATRMIRDLLDFTRARLGEGIPVRRAPCDFHLLTQQAVEEVRLAHPDRDVHLTASGPGQGAWDADRLAQVITNLVNNALAYSPLDSAVRVETHGEEDALLLRVHNAGAPIPPELMPRLFEPLTRGADKVTSASRSIGLGLYIVNHIVQAHGGRIDVRSSADEGTAFTVRLPRR